MSESAKKALVVVIYAVLALSVLLVYWQAGHFEFINYDDNTYVYENPHVLSGLSHDGVIWAFTTGQASNWHPLTWLAHMLDCQLFGTNAGWMHLVNVLLHLANTLLLFAVLKKMTGSLWPSAFVAAAFALHPMHVESVAWIAERKDVLSTLFLLLTLAAYIGYVKRPSIFRYLIALTLFAAGLMAKPMLVTLPLLLLLLDYWPLNRLGNRAVLAIIEKMPFFVLAAVSSVITFVVQQSGGAVINASPLKDRIANAFLSYAEYIGKMFRPQDLAIFYPFDAGSIISWQVAMCVLLLLAISILVIRFGRRQKYLPVGWFWFVVTLVPVIGFVQVGSQAIADRYTYMPYIGLFIMLAWGLPELLSKLPQRKIALGLSMAMALTVLGIVAHRQASYWNDSITLFSHATLVTQNNYLAHNNRGAAYGKTGRWQEAIEDFREAVKIKPDDAETYNNLGAAYESLGRGTEAIAAYKQAIRIKPDHAETYCALGRVYGELGRSAEAIEAYRQAIMLKPDNAEAYNDLGIAYVRLGRGAEAMEAFRLAMKIEPDNAQMLNNLAWLIATGPDIRNRDTNEAIRLAKGACELTNYKNPVFLCTLAAAYASAGKFSEAVDTAKKAMDLADAANQPQVRNIIGQHLSLYKQGKPYIEPSPQSPPEGNKP